VRFSVLKSKRKSRKTTVLTKVALDLGGRRSQMPENGLFVQNWKCTIVIVSKLYRHFSYKVARLGKGVSNISWP
jgi:hypothetical protein